MGMRCRDDHHASASRFACDDASRSVFEHQTAMWIETKLLCAELEAFGARLAALDIFCRNNGFRQRQSGCLDAASGQLKRGGCDNRSAIFR